jgi:hypothetical protein
VDTTTATYDKNKIYYTRNGENKYTVAQIPTDGFDENVTYYIENLETEGRDEPSYGLFGYNEGKAIFSLQQENPYFAIRTPSGNTLISISGKTEDGEDGEFYLQSENYKPFRIDSNGHVVEMGTGMFINLKDGEINNQNINSILYAKEIKAASAISLVEISKDSVTGEDVPVETVSITDGKITTMASESNELVAGQRFLNPDGTLNYVQGLSIQPKDDDEAGIDVILRGAILQECTMEGQFSADGAVIQGVTIENGKIS